MLLHFAHLITELRIVPGTHIYILKNCNNAIQPEWSLKDYIPPAPKSHSLANSVLQTTGLLICSCLLSPCTSVTEKPKIPRTIRITQTLITKEIYTIPNWPHLSLHNNTEIFSILPSCYIISKISYIILKLFSELSLLHLILTNLRTLLSVESS